MLASPREWVPTQRRGAVAEEGATQGKDSPSGKPPQYGPGAETLYTPLLRELCNQPQASSGEEQRDPVPTQAETYGASVSKLEEGVSSSGKLPVQALPVNLVWSPNRPASCYPWQAKNLQNLLKAVKKDGPNSPWALALLQEVACMHPQGLEGPGPGCSPWTSIPKMECLLLRCM